MGGDKLAVLDAFNAELLHQLEGLQVLLDFTRDIAAAVHLALIEHIQESLIDFDTLLEEGISHVELAAGGISVPQVAGYGRAALDKVRIAHVAVRYPLAVGAPGAPLHIVNVVLPGHAITSWDSC
jgi:hypothetical protein